MMYCVWFYYGYEDGDGNWTDFNCDMTFFEGKEKAKKAFEEGKHKIDDMSEWFRPGYYSEKITRIETEEVEGAYHKTGYYHNASVGLILGVHFTPITDGTVLFQRDY